MARLCCSLLIAVARDVCAAAVLAIFCVEKRGAPSWETPG